jgi:predicted small metal-binding protein
MKQFYCGAVMPGREAKLMGETEQAILVRVAQDAARGHGLKELPPSVLVQDQLRERADRERP